MRCKGLGVLGPSGVSGLRVYRDLGLRVYRDLGFEGYSPSGVILRLYWVYLGIMEKNMEMTIMGYIGFRVYLGPPM